MALIIANLLGRTFPDQEFFYSTDKSCLYALSVGMAQDPMDLRELDFVSGPEPKVLPSQATVIAWDYDFIIDSGVDQVLILHGGQSVTVHNPLPSSAEIVSSFRIRDVYDKGPGKGAVIIAETKIREKHSGKPLTTNVWTSYARGEGGFGGERGPSLTPASMPERSPDIVVDRVGFLNQPLFYRLLGDENPLHYDPRVAQAAGFEYPIMHGNCTFGMACAAVVEAVCDYDPARLKDFSCSFSAPGKPGDTLRAEIWIEGDIARFRAYSVERGVELVSNGKAVVSRA